MSYPNDESIVSLGVPSKVVGDDMSEKERSRLSRIGGRPLWHDPASAPSLNIMCKSCSSNESVLMVAQIYAPTDRDRSLYVFCCNTRLCSLRDEGWTIIRNQAKKPFDEERSLTKDNSISSEAAAPTASIESVWGEDTSQLGGGGGESAFGDLAPLGGDDNDDLLAMLEARDDALCSTQLQNASVAKDAASGGKATLPYRSSSEGAITSLSWTPSRIIEHEDDVTRERCGDDSDDEENDHQSYLQSQVASDGKVQELLGRYLADEDDPELLMRLTGADPNLGGGDSGKKQKEEEDEDNDDDKDEDEDKDKDEDEDGGDGVGKNDEDKDRESNGDSRSSKAIFDGFDKKLVKGGASAEAEWKFQRRVSSQPRQVLRYAYGGEPLWNTLPASKERAKGISVPCCEGCGARRVFEVQLMPAILTLNVTVVNNVTGVVQKKSNMSLESSIKKNAAAGAGAGASAGNESAHYPQPTASQLEKLKSVIDDGLDFGVLSIWVCPNSCEASVSEAALVQVPADF